MDRTYVFVVTVVVFNGEDSVHAQCHKPVSHCAQTVPARPVHTLVRCARSYAAYEQTHAEHNAQ